MNKIGIVGQIALMFVLPGIGGALMKGLSGMAGTMIGSNFALIRGAGAVLNTALKFAQTGGNIYRTVTEGITDFIGTAGKYIGGKLGVKVGGEKLANMTLSEAWGTYSNEVMKNVTSIVDPWKQAVTINPSLGSTIADQAKAVGMTPEDFVKNYNMPENVTASMQGLVGDDLANFRFGTSATMDSAGVWHRQPLKSFQATRNTDFWGFEISKEATKKSLIDIGINDPVFAAGESFSPVPEAEVIQGTRLPEMKSDSLLKAPSNAMPTLDDALYSSGGPGLGVPTVPPKDTWGQAMKRYAGTQVTEARGRVLNLPADLAVSYGQNLIADAITGPPPEYEPPKRGGVDYFTPSDPTLAYNIVGQPIATGGAGGISFGGVSYLNGTNTDPSGSINGRADYINRMARYGIRVAGVAG